MYHVFDATIASFATTSGEVDLSRGFRSVFLVIPTMTSNSQVHIQAADVSGGNYRRVLQHDAASATVSVDFAIPSATTNRIVRLREMEGLRYFKVETTAVVSFSAAFQVICEDATW